MSCPLPGGPVPVPVSQAEVMPRPAQILLIQTATGSAAAAGNAPAAVAPVTAPLIQTPAILSVTPASQPSVAVMAGASVPIIYSQRLPPGRLPHVQPPVLSHETRSRVIIEAIDALRGRKARPDENRITHWVNRRYGIQKDDAIEIIQQSVAEGSVIRVKYKDSISYRNPAKFPRSTAQVNQMIIQKQRLQHLQSRQQTGIGGNLALHKNSTQRILSPDGASTGSPEDDCPATTALPAGTSAPIPLAPIPAIKKILRAIRTLTTKSSDPSAGASVQQVISLIGQRELGFPASFVSRVLKAGVIQGTVRLLPSGNYILASGSSFKKKTTVGRKVTHSAQSPGASVANGGDTAAAEQFDLKASRLSETGAQSKPHSPVKKTAVSQEAQPQTLLQSRFVAPPLTDPSAGPDASAAAAVGAAHAPKVSSNINDNNAAAAVSGNQPLRQSHAPTHKLLQRKKKPSSTASAAVLMPADVSVRRRKKLHFRKLLANRVVGGNRVRIPTDGCESVVSSAKSGAERGRPMSQRKKFKKNLGPDFLQPSDMGMQYLQNMFEPKCDYCDRPASRSPRNKCEEFLICKDCDFKAHPKSCLKYSEELISRCRETEWQCQYCKDCCMCIKSGDVESILFCDACDQGYHMACHNPPLPAKPDGAWICTYCQLRRKTGIILPRPGPKAVAASDDGFDEESEEILESEVDEDEEMDVQTVGLRAGLAIRSAERDQTQRIISQLQPAVESITVSHPHIPICPKDWTVADVETFVRFIGFSEQASTFRDQEVDGMSLLLLKRSDLLSGMDLKLGPALKIYGHVQRLQSIRSLVENASTNGTIDAHI